MSKPIFLLATALALASTTIASAKADANRTVTILTMMETGKPTVSVDVSDLKVTFKSDEATYDAGGKNSVTRTAIAKGNTIITAVDKGGKRIDYAVKDGVTILTSTLIKASPKPKAKAGKKP